MRKSGFTLLEVMVASGILLMVTLSILAATTAVMRNNFINDSYYKATSAARNSIQHISAMPFNSMVSMNKSSNRMNPDGNLCATGTFMRSTIVTNSATNAIDITVQIFFPVEYGKLSTKPVEMKTKFASGM